MSQTVTITQNRFDGGVSDSSRKPSANECIICKHFDIFTDPYRLIPYRSLEADTETSVSATDLKQYFVRDFVFASASAKLYGLGQTGAGLTKILQKADATTGLWTTPASSEGNGAVKNGCFFEFKDYMWGFQGTNQIFKWGLLSGTPSITNSVATVASTITSVANGVINSLGDAYVAYNNVVVRIAPDTTTVTDSAKTVPANYKIVQLENYGDYLAIGCAPVSTYNGVSKIFLWDYASTDRFQAIIDLGEGELRVLGNVEGMLMSIVDRYLNNSVGAGRGSMIIQAYVGGSPQVLKEVFTQKLVGQAMSTSKAIKNNRLFFHAKIMTNTAGTTYDEGIWSFGRKSASYPWALSLDIIDENVTTAGIQYFGTAGNYFFLAYNADGSVDKTNDAATYAFTSIYETQSFDFGDVDSDKRLESVKVSFRKLASGESVTLKYKVDDATSFTTIGTASTDDDVSHTFLSIEATDTNFASGKEYKFQITSTGGAEITGIKMKATILNNP